MKKRRKASPKRLKRIPQKWLVWLFGVVILTGLLAPFVLSFPNVEDLRFDVPGDTTRVMASGNEIIASIHKDEFRSEVLFENISPYLRQAVLAAEDARFYEHHGIDPIGIARAVWTNIIHLEFHRQGASTITQQLARTLYLTRQKTFLRKFAEAVLAIQLERTYTKDAIFSLYLNHVYWGHNAYGAEAAAQIYYGKHAKDLTLAEASLMAGIIGAPDLFSPYKNLTFAKNRQIYVLQRMTDLNMITPQLARETEEIPLRFTMSQVNQYKYAAPYFTSVVLAQLEKTVGHDAVESGGYQVETTVDLKMQRAAEEAVETMVKSEGAKYNFHQAALVAIDPRTGDVKALVGGSNFAVSEYNRAVQSRRQPGSSFKPFVYTAAMEDSVSPGDVLMDRPVTFSVPFSNSTPNGKWAPKDFDRKWRGPVTVRYALEHSLNIPAIHLMERVGISHAIDVARRMGITSPLNPGLSLTLGTSELSLLELTSAYTAFATGGIAATPRMIIKVTDPKGAVTLQTQPQTHKAINPKIAAAMVQMMKGVLLRGTGVRGQIGRPSAAKTGTTENFRDAWMVGYVPQLVVGVWVGNDDNQPMQGVAEVAVCPRLWKAFMLRALADLPAEDFPGPEEMTSVTICVDSGKLPTEFCPANRLRTDLFWNGHEPHDRCTVHTPQNNKEETPADHGL